MVWAGDVSTSAASPAPTAEPGGRAARIGGPAGEKLEQMWKNLAILCPHRSIVRLPPIPRWSGEFPARV
jgi:hypothetical protein